jgi:hypothetical protein
MARLFCFALVMAAVLLRTSQAQVWFGPQGASLSGGVTGIDFDFDEIKHKQSWSPVWNRLWV